MTLRIERSVRQRFTVFTLSGRMEAAQVELKKLFERDYLHIILDLRDVRLADRDAVRFLRGCEADGMSLRSVLRMFGSGWTEKKIEGTTNWHC